MPSEKSEEEDSGRDGGEGIATKELDGKQKAVFVVESVP